MWDGHGRDSLPGFLPSKIRRQARPSNAKNTSNSKNPTDIMHRSIVRSLSQCSYKSLSLVLYSQSLDVLSCAWHL
jgi:hypothetical protein